MHQTVIKALAMHLRDIFTHPLQLRENQKTKNKTYLEPNRRAISNKRRHKPQTISTLKQINNKIGCDEGFFRLDTE